KLDFDVDDAGRRDLRIEGVDFNKVDATHFLQGFVKNYVKDLGKDINRQIVDYSMPFLRRLQYFGLGSRFSFKRLVMNDSGDAYIFFRQQEYQEENRSRPNN